MNAITNLDFEGNLVRVIDRAGLPWFVAKDVCACLGIKDHRSAVQKLDPDEKGVASIHSLGGDQDQTIVNLSGHSALILRSRQAMTPGTPQHRYRKWITAEVIPSIFKTGSYTMAAVAPMPAGNPTSTVETGTLLAAMVGLLKLVERAAGPEAMLDYMPTLGLRSARPLAQQDDLACLRHLWSYETPRGRVRELVEQCFARREGVIGFLKGLGIVFRGDGIVIYNAHPVIAEVYAGTRWRRPFEHFRRLPGAKPFDPNGGGRAGEGTYIPSTYLDLH